MLNFVVQLAQQLEPVHPGQLDVNQDHIGSEFRELGESFFAAGNTQDLEIQFAKVGFITLPGVVFVFDNQYALRLILWWHRSIEPNSSFAEIQADARQAWQLWRSDCHAMKRTGTRYPDDQRLTARQTGEVFASIESLTSDRREEVARERVSSLVPFSRVNSWPSP